MRCSISASRISQAAVPADYTGNGNVTKLGQINAQPPSPYYGDNTSTGTLYNGIWGYATGSREYALQCNSFGLHVIDVTDPAAAFRVQYIDMSGGVSPPKGRIWRDVDIHEDPVSGKTYAYVGAQSNGNLLGRRSLLSFRLDRARRRFQSDPARRASPTGTHELRPYDVRQRRHGPPVHELGQQRVHARLPGFRSAPESFRSARDRKLERQRPRLP